MKITDALDCGNIHLTRRIVCPPMATHTSKEGKPTELTAVHYTDIAENPLVGLIITEHSYIDPQGKADPRQISFATDDVIDVQRKLTHKVHESNSDLKIFAQINHAGANTTQLITGESVVGPSILQLKNGFSRELSIDEIHVIEKKFADAAFRVKESGYDGVEIHAAHGYLLNEFYSPLSNFRKDIYGAQNIENRTRFLIETIEEVRKKVGKEFPVAVRLGGADYMEGGSTINDAADAAVLIEKAGADMIDLSGGLCGFMRKDNHHPGWFTDMSEAVKKKVSKPVMVTGGITLADQAEEILEQGKADLVGVGRGLYQNPKWGEQ